MNKLILCEGKTDAILLSYYLDNVYGWKPVRKPYPKHLRSLDIKPDTPNQSVYWYNKKDDYLLICAVGGCNNFGNFYNQKIHQPILQTDAFHKIAIVTDCDDGTPETIANRLYIELGRTIEQPTPNEWITHQYKNAFNQDKSLEVLLLVIPQNSQGALETVLLEAIAENPYDKSIVVECCKFVDNLRATANRYITSDRLALKAKLSTTWAIQSPEKVFDFINEQLLSVRWEESAILKQCFSQLEHL